MAARVKVFNRLRVMRTDRGLTRQEVADAVGAEFHVQRTAELRIAVRRRDL